MWCVVVQVQVVAQVLRDAACGEDGRHQGAAGEDEPHWSPSLGYLVPGGTWCLVLYLGWGTWYLEWGTWYLLLYLGWSTWYLVPGVGYLG